MKTLTKEQREEIINNYSNGNFSDFKEQVRKLRKFQIVDLIQYFFYINHFLSERELFLSRLYGMLI